MNNTQIYCEEDSQKEVFSRQQCVPFSVLVERLLVGLGLQV